jgi:hypothetical protein
MKNNIYFFVLFLIGCNSKVIPHGIENKLMINKNYIFCVCLNKMNRKYNLDWHNPKSKTVIDGSIEVFFVDENFNVDIDSVDIFINKYLDSLENGNQFRSYNDNSLGVAKCLDLYNSIILEDFLKKEFSRN